MDTSASPAKTDEPIETKSKVSEFCLENRRKLINSPKQRGFLERRHSNLRSRHERHIVGKEMRYFEQLFTYIQKAKKLKLSDYLRRRPEEMTAVTYLCRRRRKGSVVGGHHGECGARVYNGGLGAEPLVRESGGEAPLKLKAFWSLDVQRSRQI